MQVIAKREKNLADNFQNITLDHVNTILTSIFCPFTAKQVDLPCLVSKIKEFPQSRYHEYTNFFQICDYATTNIY